MFEPWVPTTTPLPDFTFCPATGENVDYGDCSKCTGLYFFLKSANQCVEQRPQMSYDFCGLEEDKNFPPKTCDKKVVELLNCIGTCNTEVGLTPMRQAMGQCMSSTKCGQMQCRITCDCVDPEAECKQPCYASCIRYEQCVVNGDGMRTTSVADFMAYYDQCVMDKKPPMRPDSTQYDNIDNGGGHVICGCQRQR